MDNFGKNGAARKISSFLGIGNAVEQYNGYLPAPSLTRKLAALRIVVEDRAVPLRNTALSPLPAYRPPQ
ncbi:hypothetical protein ON010_g8696 [Phytophthora cinnamomi]|nr:hypothetical protein ON010_g8696 [Phytophthora cinnamomi]